MELIYRMMNNEVKEQITSLAQAYETAEYHLPHCKEGDSLTVREADLKIKFYKRKGTKLYSISKPRETECQVALYLLRQNLIL